MTWQPKQPAGWRPALSIDLPAPQAFLAFANLAHHVGAPGAQCFLDGDLDREQFSYTLQGHMQQLHFVRSSPSPCPLRRQHRTHAFAISVGSQPKSSTMALATSWCPSVRASSPGPATASWGPRTGMGLRGEGTSQDLLRQGTKVGKALKHYPLDR